MIACGNSLDVNQQEHMKKDPTAKLKQHIRWEIINFALTMETSTCKLTPM